MIISRLRMFFNYVRFLKNFHDPVLFWLGLDRRDARYYALRDGRVVRLRSHHLDGSVFHEVVLDNIYFKAPISMKDGDTIIDIGAHIGMFSLVAAKSARGVTVHAIEPGPDNLRILKENMALNGLSNVFMHNFAVHASDGAASLTVASAEGALNTLEREMLPKIRVKTELVKARTVSLDSFIKANRIRSVGLLKLDCEGSEYAILGSLSEAAWAVIRQITMEYHNLDAARNAQALIRLLRSKGYAVACEKPSSAPLGIGMIYAVKDPR